MGSDISFLAGTGVLRYHDDGNGELHETFYGNDYGVLRTNNSPDYISNRGSGGLVVKSRPRGRRVPGSKPYPIKELPRKQVRCTPNQLGPNALPLHSVISP
ncbi:hypothetical protein AVEN_136354-1 [Araneus ventricosus]|uniref:Uncharacterized protein n=1 Tax=Araneus ventricosus TaxID=182803 RepID=A0A4Y2E1B8_ARAVE|nr:hypothetical protein AVEN_136354-1 [Araneus ventricosus]